MRLPAAIILIMICSSESFAVFPVAPNPSSSNEPALKPERAVERREEPEKSGDGQKGDEEKKNADSGDRNQNEKDNVSTQGCTSRLSHAVKACTAVEKVKPQHLFQDASFEADSISQAAEGSARLHRARYLAYESQSDSCEDAINSCVKTCNQGLIRTQDPEKQKTLSSAFGTCKSLTDEHAKIEKAKYEARRAEDASREAAKSSGSNDRNKPRPGGLIPDKEVPEGTAGRREANRGAPSIPQPTSTSPSPEPSYAGRSEDVSAPLPTPRPTQQNEREGRSWNPAANRDDSKKNWPSTEPYRVSDSASRARNGDIAEELSREGHREGQQQSEARAGARVPQQARGGSTGFEPMMLSTMGAGMPVSGMRSPASATAAAMPASVGTSFSTRPGPGQVLPQAPLPGGHQNSAGSTAQGRFRSGDPRTGALAVDSVRSGEEASFPVTSYKQSNGFRAASAGGGGFSGGGGHWQPSVGGAKLDPHKPYDGRARIDTARLLNRPLQVDDGGGGGGGGTRFRPDQRPINLPDYLPNGAKYRPQHAGGASQNSLGLQSKTVDIWGQITNRFHAHCLTGRLRDCQLGKQD